MDQGKGGAGPLASQLLAECDLLEVDYTKFDEAVLSHILTLVFYQIRRWPDAEANGMLHLSCHDNAVLMERADRSGARQAVHGWWRNAHGFVFHSVIAVDGWLTCVTPIYASLGQDDTQLLFAPDPLIERVNENGILALHIMGRSVPRRLSLNPEYDRKLAAELRARLAVGYDPERIAREPVVINV